VIDDIEHLDFQPSSVCAYAECDATPSWRYRCTVCDTAGALCSPHHDQLAALSGNRLICTRCLSADRGAVLLTFERV
jgi:hypothetical protein